MRVGISREGPRAENLHNPAQQEVRQGSASTVTSPSRPMSEIGPTRMGAAKANTGKAADRLVGGIGKTVFVVIPNIVTGTLLLAGIAINFANVAARYMFAYAIPWAEEVLVFLMLWMVFVAAIAIAYRGSHINMDLFYVKFPKRMKVVVNAAIAISFILCCSFVAFQSLKIVRLRIMTGSVSLASGLPDWIPALAIFTGMAFTAFVVLVRFKNYLTGKFD